MRFPWAPLERSLKIFTDSDHAGCLRTRKSTSGGVIVWGHAIIKTWSRTQSLIALSSGESELVALGGKASLGRVRHLATADLWIQQKVKARELKIYKLPGKDNPSDFMTKHKSEPEAQRFLKMLASSLYPGDRRSPPADANCYVRD